MKKIIIGTLIAGFLLFAGSCGLFMYELKRKESGEHVASVKWLPESATDITYVKEMFIVECEFAIPEADFVAFGKEKGRYLEEMEKSKAIMPRIISPERRRFLRMDDTGDAESLIKTSEEAHLRATKGLFYQEQWGNGGGYTFLYNRDTGRTYYWYAHH
jgi:hypothetical protein